MQKISDVECFKAVFACAGLVDLLMNGTKEDFEVAGIESIKQATLEIFATIKAYDGTNETLLKGQKDLMDAIPHLQSFYADLEEDLKKRA